MANYKEETRTTTDEVRSFDIRKINKKCLNDVGWYGYYDCQNSDVIKYLVKKGGIVLHHNSQAIALKKTNCNYGGYRHWLECPQCKKRFSTLYEDRGTFLCRICHKLCYRSQKENEVDLLIRKMRNIRKRVGASLNITVPISEKPKGMHWNTFTHLKEEERQLSREYAYSVIRHLGLRMEDLW